MKKWRKNPMSKKNNNNQHLKQRIREQQAEIDAIINTTTDAEKVTSPFITVANQVRNSVVGVNNYARASYYGYGYGYGYRYAL